jgi:hypothetical protein
MFAFWRCLKANGAPKGQRQTPRIAHRLYLEPLEDRLAPSITQVTNEAFDHRWPSINNQGDYVYSAQVNGLWQVFLNGAQMTSDGHNNEYPSIDDNGDILYFKDGGSGGIGWQIVLRSASGSESTIEISSSNSLSGAHRDANPFSGIASNGTTISGYDFYDSGFDSIPTRRFNVSGIGRLAPDFYPFDIPDINTSGEILYAGAGSVRKASISSPFPGVIASAGTMGRINDAGDIVVVSGNLNTPGTVTILAGPDHAQSTLVGNGSWADINNSGEVLFENLDAQGRRQVFLFRPDDIDIIATSLTWNTEQGGVDFSYAVTGAELTQDTTAALYWATGTTFADAIPDNDGMVRPEYSTTIERQVGEYGPFYVPNSVLDTPPPAATHLLLVTDPPTATMPDGLIAESDETNNVRALAIPDIVIQSAQLQAGDTVQFTYETTGNPGPFEVALYRSGDGLTYDSADRIGDLQTVTPSPTNPQAPGTFTLPSPWTGDPSKRYLVVVADPDDAITEADNNNNSANLLLPDINVVSFNIDLDAGGLAYSYQINGANLTADTEFTLFWSEDSSFDPQSDILAYDFPIQGSDRNVGVESGLLLPSLYLYLSSLRPRGFQYLILVLDPGSVGRPEGLINESNETNNSLAIRVAYSILPPNPGGGIGGPGSGNSDNDDPPPSTIPIPVPDLDAIRQGVPRLYLPEPKGRAFIPSAGPLQAEMGTNDGSAQRSMVNRITVTFSGVVTLPDDPTNAFLLVQQGGGSVGLNVSTSVVNGKSVAVLTFTGPGIVGGSLADGNYTLTIRGDLIRDRIGQSVDGDGDSFAGGDHLDAFFRLFGDSDGDADVDVRNLLRFVRALGSHEGDQDYPWYLDYDLNGRVGVIDVLAFAHRLGHRI